VCINALLQGRSIGTNRRVTKQQISTILEIAEGYAAGPSPAMDTLENIQKNLCSNSGNPALDRSYTPWYGG
jgi:hypothetical protein